MSELKTTTEDDGKSFPELPTLGVFDKFLDLPGEVRNHIYSILLIDPFGIILGLSPGVSKHGDGIIAGDIIDWLNSNRRKDIIHQATNLSLVNRQIYKESCSIFFSINRFIFPSSHYMKTFLQRLPPQYTTLITAVDTKAHMPNLNYIATSLEYLSCLAQAKNLRKVYISVWLRCVEQHALKDLVLRQLPGLQPHVEFVVELTNCHHCLLDTDCISDRDWWIWTRRGGNQEWSVVHRRGVEEIDRIGFALRSRPLAPDWALGRITYYQ